jgi:hypothetical protein
MFDCDNPQAKKLFYFCIHGLEDRVRTLLSSVENPNELIFAPVSNRSISILTFVVKNTNNLKLGLMMIEYLKDYDYCEDPYFLMDLFISCGQQEWIFEKLNKITQFTPHKVEGMLLEAAGFGDVNFLTQLEKHFGKEVSELSNDRVGEVGLCTSSVSRKTQENGSLEMIQFLFDNRNANIEDWSDISLALNYGRFDLAEYLIQNGASAQRNLCALPGRVSNFSKSVHFLCNQGAELDQMFLQICIAQRNIVITDVMRLHASITIQILQYTLQEIDVIYQEFLDTIVATKNEFFENGVINSDSIRGILSQEELKILLPLLIYPTELLRWHVREIKETLPLCSVCLDSRYLRQMRNLTSSKECREFVMDVIQEENEFGKALITRLSEAFYFTSSNKEAFVVQFNDMMNMTAKAEERFSQISLGLSSASQPEQAPEPHALTF